MFDLPLLICCSKMATPTAIPASNASTGSSRPPDPPKPPLANLYDPFAAESYDYDPFGSEPAPVERPHMLPPLPSMAPTPSTNKPARAADPAAALGTANTASDRQTSQVAQMLNSTPVNGMAGKSAAAAAPLSVLPPLPSQPALASRKRKSRWEDAAPEAANHAAHPASVHLPDAAAPAIPAMPAVPAEAPRPRRSRFSDAPPPAAAVHAASPQPGQGSIQSLPTETFSTPDVLPKPPQPSPKAKVVLPPKPASARQDGEAQAAAALQAVEQMLQAKRHSDARNIAPSTSRPKQPPLPAHQPPLPRPPPPQPPLPQMPPPQPAFTDAMDSGSSHAAAGPSWHAGHAVHALPALNPRPPPPFLGQPPGFPHAPTMLQGFPPGIPRPHMGHFAPQQFVQAGLQQHHMPAPLHHLPSMLQTPPRPPPQGRPQLQSSAPQQYRPPPPASWPPPQQPAPPRQPQPLGQGSFALDRQASIGKVDEQPGRPVTSAGARHLPSEADLGHFHSTSVAMDTPTDAGPGFPWKRVLQEGPPRNPGTVASTTAPQLRSNQDVDQTQTSVQPAADQAVPGPPPSPPIAPPPPPPLLPMPGSSATAPPAAAAPSGHDDATLASGDQAQSDAFLSVEPAAAASAAAIAAATVPADALAGESRMPTPAPNAAAAALAAAPHASSEVTAAVDHPLAPDAAHAAAPAGPAGDSHEQHNGTCCHALVMLW